MVRKGLTVRVRQRALHERPAKQQDFLRCWTACDLCPNVSGHRMGTDLHRVARTLPLFQPKAGQPPRPTRRWCVERREVGRVAHDLGVVGDEEHPEGHAEADEQESSRCPAIRAGSSLLAPRRSPPCRRREGRTTGMAHRVDLAGRTADRAGCYRSTGSADGVEEEHGVTRPRSGGVGLRS